MAEARPYSKDIQLARAETRHHRKVASKGRWQKIAAEKQGSCRVCAEPPPNDLAHLIGRAQAGPDAAWNIAPLCRLHHTLFDVRDMRVCRAVCETLTNDEYAGLISFGGEQVFERRFGIAYERLS